MGPDGIPRRRRKSVRSQTLEVSQSENEPCSRLPRRHSEGCKRRSQRRRNQSGNPEFCRAGGADGLASVDERTANAGASDAADALLRGCADAGSSEGRIRSGGVAGVTAWALRAVGIARANAGSGLCEALAARQGLPPQAASLAQVATHELLLYVAAPPVAAPTAKQSELVAHPVDPATGSQNSPVKQSKSL